MLANHSRPDCGSMPGLVKVQKRGEKLARSRAFRALTEMLEARITPSTYTVTDLSDGAGSATDVTLRYAITQAVTSHDQNAVIGFALDEPRQQSHDYFDRQRHGFQYELRADGLCDQ